LVVSDLVTNHGRHQVELFFHLGPAVTALLDGDRALLSWSHRGTTRLANLHLPPELSWSTHRGESDPPLGWYSPAFGERVPATTLVGAGDVHGHVTLETELVFHEVSPTDHALGVGR
jgi:hypothetical protein